MNTVPTRLNFQKQQWKKSGMQLSNNKRGAEIDWAVLAVFHVGRESCKLR